MKRNKVLGALFGAAIGDSFGAITESCSRREIRKAFPEGYRDYAKSISFITKDIVPGCVTDDFGSSVYIMQTIIKHHGEMNREIAVEAVLAWSDDPIVYARYAGHNTKTAIERLKEGKIIDELLRIRHFNGANTNGAAMKAAPMGLLAKGNLSYAEKYAMDLSYPTHYNSAACSAAAAIAAAVCAAAKENSTLSDIESAAITGCQNVREKLEDEGYASSGPYTDERIRMALDLVVNVRTDEELMDILEAKIGTGIAVQESIPAVFAIIHGTNGDFERSLYVAANAGGDTDTIASMCGAILGAYHGIDVLKKEYIEKVQKENEFLRLNETIEEYTDLICKEANYD